MKQLFLIFSLLLSQPVLATEPGNELPAYELKDQNDKAQVLTTDIKRIYASQDRKGDKLLEAAMKDLSQEILDTQQAVVIADISNAPFFIKPVIKSGLEERSYNTWVDGKGKTQKAIPYREDRVTVLDIDNMKITAIRYISDVDSLKQELTNTTEK